MNRITRRRTFATVALLALASVVAMAMGPASAEVYLGGGTAVYKQQGEAPAADEGTLVCTTSGVAVGGGCLPFGSGGFVEVLDTLNGHNVAFQVCIDNNGDGVCTSPDRSPEAGACSDLVVFSHNDDGLFFNPLGPLPSSFKQGCGANAPWQGYVVFLCNGVHNGTTDGTGAPIPVNPHTHETTVGTISNAGPLAPSGFGNFCGGTEQTPTRKPYTVIAN